MAEPVSKSGLRRWALEHRRALTKDHLLEMSARVVDNLKKVPEFQSARHVLTCLSFNNEVDTWPLAEELAAGGDRRVYVPRVDVDGVMHVHPYPCNLRTLRMGLRQPAPDEAETPREQVDAILDVALVLGLVFERRRGYRLGYGKGHFDRFLHGRPCCAIGLSLEDFLVDQIPAEAHDIPMRLIVTEQRVYRCEQQEAEEP